MTGDVARFLGRRQRECERPGRAPNLVDAAAGLLRGYGGRVEVRMTRDLDELAAVVSEEERRLVLLAHRDRHKAAGNGPLRRPRRRRR